VSQQDKLVRRAVFWRRFHFACIVTWFALWGVATWTDWISSTRFVSHISMLALVLSSAGAWQAARAEVTSAENP
jgi:hypothetical protein